MLHGYCRVLILYETETTYFALFSIVQTLYTIELLMKKKSLQFTHNCDGIL